MKFIDSLKNSSLWNSAESRAALFVTAVLVIIAGFLVYNYYDKTNTLDGSNNAKLEEIQNENSKQTTTTAAISAENSSGNTLGTQVEKKNVYKVMAGDTLWSIALSQLGDAYRWVEIKNENSLKSSELEIGQSLILPNVKSAEKVIASNNQDSTEKQDSTQITKTAETETVTNTTSYTVQHGDTLWNIAQKVYGDPYQWTKILNANNLGRLPNGQVLIHSGNVLTIPALN